MLLFMMKEERGVCNSVGKSAEEFYMEGRHCLIARDHTGRVSHSQTSP